MHVVSNKIRFRLELIDCGLLPWPPEASLLQMHSLTAMNINTSKLQTFQKQRLLDRVRIETQPESCTLRYCLKIGPY